MSGFELVPLHGGDAIPLSPGETVLGRGPFLRVSDKRVSRHHGVLDVRDGRLRLKATHMNPCFVQRHTGEQPRALQKDTWCSLEDGHILSLLPGQLMFQVALTPGPDGARRDPAFAPRSPPSPPSRHGGQPPAWSTREARLNQTDGMPRTQEATAVAAPGPPRNKRILPQWMLAAVKLPPSPSASDICQGAKKSQGSQLSEDEDKTNVKRRRKQGQAREQAKSKANDEQTQPEACDVTSQPDAGSPAQERDRSASGARRACPYGKDCYRKNPLHFAQHSHPGDWDYEEKEEEGPDECPYGAECYRKNPLHRKQYTHPPAAALKRWALLEVGSTSCPDSDSGGAFSDDDGDSDYVPPPDSD